MTQDMITHKDHNKHYLAIPRFAAWVAIVIFVFSAVFSAGGSYKILYEQKDTITEIKETAKELEERVRDTEQTNVRLVEQNERIIFELQELRREMRER